MEFIKEQLLLSFDQNFGHLGKTENVDLKKIFKFLRENDFQLQKLKNGKYHCKVRLSEKLLQINTILITVFLITVFLASSLKHAYFLESTASFQGKFEKEPERCEISSLNIIDIPK